MHTNINHAPIRPPAIRTATRFTVNRDWCWRGDNTKYKAKK